MANINVMVYFAISYVFVKSVCSLIGVTPDPWRNEMYHCDECCKEVPGTDRFFHGKGILCDNCRRISNAARALKSYKDGNDLQSPVVDLMTDLRHYCNKYGVDMDIVIRLSHDHCTMEHLDIEC